ncbi:MAG: response regulator [bacterium]|nr:response regulator [bacterium]
MKTIAVIEDNPDNRLLVHAILEDAYSIVEYESGPEALEGMATSHPDLILLDISLPEMDGVEVLSCIRTSETLKNIPVIALTAHAMSGDREKYLAQGFNEYITKPIVDEDILIQAIQSWLPENE